MTDPSAAQPSTAPKKRWSPLWWTVPLAFAVALVPWWIARSSMCSISACTGGGFDPTHVLRGQVIPLLAVSSGVLALPFVFAPWNPRWTIRLVVGLWVAVVWAGLSAIWIYSMA